VRILELKILLLWSRAGSIDAFLTQIAAATGAAKRERVHSGAAISRK
jgi:hypothetical protein